MVAFILPNTGPVVAACVATPGRSFQFTHDAGHDAAEPLPSVVSQLAHGSHHGGGLVTEASEGVPDPARPADA